MSDVRLIERWLPIAALGEESVRERRAASSLPPLNYLHVWWARRPLVASRAAILGSLLPADLPKQDFLELLGILGDPVATRKRIERAKRARSKLESNPYGYPRAFEHSLSEAELRRITSLGINQNTIIVDPTAGGGSIPLEAVRLGCQVYANDLNPVSALILSSVFDYIIRYKYLIAEEFRSVADRFFRLSEQRLASLFKPAFPNERVNGYIWARTIECPYCAGRIPLSPNWRLSGSGAGVRLIPRCENGRTSGNRFCDFEVVNDNKLHSDGTVSDGDATCPFPDCRRVIQNLEIKRIAEGGAMGHQLFALSISRLERKMSKSGKEKLTWVRDFRIPIGADYDHDQVQQLLQDHLREWELSDVVPTEILPLDTESWTHGNTPAQYGAKTFADLFSARQLITHAILVAAYREMVTADEAEKKSTTHVAAPIYSLASHLISIVITIRL